MNYELDTIYELDTLGVDGNAPGESSLHGDGDSGAPRILLRWLGHVAFLFAWMVIALMAAIMWGPHVTDYETEIIVGRSMEPTIPLYSAIVVEPVDPDEIRVGDVITYDQPDLPGRKVTHRVVGIEHADGEAGGPAAPVFRTRGDNNPADDPYHVSYAAQGYRVVHHVPYIGWGMLKAQTRSARMLLVALPIVVLLTVFLRWLWSDTSEDEQDADDMLVTAA